MAAFLMFGNYSQDALSGISPRRTEEFVQLVAQNGGSVRAMFATLGEIDLVLVVDLPSVETAARVSIEVAKKMGIRLNTHPAIAVKDFDLLMTSGTSD
ncbi:MAG: GYD domain-containing protein [Thermogutta sp.]|nr:GYD domain-containing protein [Thermogutta sp.]